MPAPSQTTLIDRVNDADEPVGLVERGAVFDLGAGFRVVHVLVENASGELLLQQLSAARPRSPGRWGSSVAGYLFAGEPYLHAAERRTREEIGLQASLSKLGSIRMPDHGATKFIELFQARAEMAAIHDHEQIAQLRFWSLEEIDRAFATQPDTFTETFPFVYGLYRAAAQPQ